MIRSCSPMYVKLGLKKHGDIYPSGGHLEGHVIQLSRERVRYVIRGGDEVRGEGRGTRHRIRSIAR